MFLSRPVPGSPGRTHPSPRRPFDTVLRRTWAFARFSLSAVAATAAVTAVTTWTADAQHVYLTPESVFERAVASNPNLAAIGISADMLRADAELLGSRPEPSIEATWFPRRIFTARGSQRSRLSVQQSLPWPGVLGGRRTAALLGAERVDLETREDVLQILLDIRLAWDEAWRVAELIRITERFKADLAEFEAAAVAQYEVGNEALPPLLGIQIEARALDVTLERLLEDLSDARSRLATLADDPELTLPDSIPSRKIPREVPPAVGARTLSAEAIAHRPGLESLRVDRRRRQIDADVARLEARPDFHVALEYVDIAEEAFLTRGDGRDALGIRVGLRIPLQRASRRAPQERARLAVTEVDQRIRSLETSIQSEIGNLVEKLDAQHNQRRLLEEELIPLAKIALETALSSYRTGRIPLLQVLEAERMLFRLRSQRIEIAARLARTDARLARTTARPFQ